MTHDKILRCQKCSFKCYTQEDARVHAASERHLVFSLFREMGDGGVEVGIVEFEEHYPLVIRFLDWLDRKI